MKDSPYDFHSVFTIFLSHELCMCSFFFTFLPTLNISCSFDKSHCDKYEVILLVLVSISLIISHVEHLFTWFLAICMSSSKNCLFGTFTCFQLDCLLFCYWVIWVLYFGYCFCKFLYIMICKYLFPFSRLPFFILFMVSFTVKKLLCLMQTHWIIFAFLAIDFGVRSKKLLPGVMSRSLLSTLSFVSFMCLHLILASLIHFELILCTVSGSSPVSCVQIVHKI